MHLTFCILKLIGKQLRKPTERIGFTSARVIKTKNLSVNNVYAQLDFSERHDGCRQVVGSQEAAIKFLVTHQELSESIEPTVRGFDNPASSFFSGSRLRSLASCPLPLT
jgi:hypothetical protein